MKKIASCYKPNQYININPYGRFDAEYFIDYGVTLIVEGSITISYFSGNIKLKINAPEKLYSCLKSCLEIVNLKTTNYYREGKVYLGKNLSDLWGNEIPSTEIEYTKKVRAKAEIIGAIKEGYANKLKGLSRNYELGGKILNIKHNLFESIGIAPLDVVLSKDKAHPKFYKLNLLFEVVNVQQVKNITNAYYPKEAFTVCDLPNLPKAKHFIVPGYFLPTNRGQFRNLWSWSYDYYYKKYMQYITLILKSGLNDIHICIPNDIHKDLKVKSADVFNVKGIDIFYFDDVNLIFR